MTRATIRQLNDAFRTTFEGGRVLMTRGVAALSEATLAKVLAAVRGFDGFTADNDPYGEHDFGSVTVEGHTVFWKIDAYDASLTYGSEDPTDPEQTSRVLTIMLAEEY